MTRAIVYSFIGARQRGQHVKSSQDLTQLDLIFGVWGTEEPLPRSKQLLNNPPKTQQCARLSRSTLASAVCSAATPAGSSTASCVLALSNPSRAILVRRRVGPPHLRAHPPPPRTSLRNAPDRPARVHRVGPSRSPSTLPYPSRPSQRDFASPPPSHLA